MPYYQNRQFCPLVFHTIPAERGYRLDADYKHGMHFTALPTAWVSGFDKNEPLNRLQHRLDTDTPGASAGFLERTST